MCFVMENVNTENKEIKIIASSNKDRHKNDKLEKSGGRSARNNKLPNSIQEALNEKACLCGRCSSVIEIQSNFITC